MLINYDYNETVDDDKFLALLLARRDQELLDTDWTQLINSPLDSATITAWATYRQELRDLPKQNVAPRLIVIPVKP